MLMQLSFLRDVDFPSEYFRLDVDSVGYKILMVRMQSIFTKHGRAITEERANATLEKIIDGCLMRVNDKDKDVIRTQIYQHALERDFPERAFLNYKRPYKYKRLAAENGLDI